MNAPYITRLAALVTSVLAVPLAAQAPPFATLVANTPVVGFLTHPYLQKELAPAGQIDDELHVWQVDPVNHYNAHLDATLVSTVGKADLTLRLRSSGAGAYLGVGIVFDISLTITPPIGTTCSLSAEIIGHGIDTTWSDLDVDFGNDGSVDLDAAGGLCWYCNLDHRHSASIAGSAGSFPIRIVGHTVSMFAVDFSLDVHVRPQVGSVTLVDGDCGVQRLTGSSSHFVTNNQLRAVATATPNESLRLMSVGLAQFGTFLVSDQSSSSPLPSIFGLGTCPLLANVLFTEQGVVTETQTPGLASSWEMPFPILPPGLVLYVQHVGVYFWTAGGWVFHELGGSNVLRIDT